MITSKNKSGFTMIEVMIVLAIAGLIVTIVFLAVPALQRNSRNNARNKDAALVTAAVLECLEHRNLVVAQCNNSANVDPGQFAELDSFTFGTPVSYSQTEARIIFGFQCNNSGDQAVGGAGSRSFAVTYQLEPAINRCIAS